MRTLPTEYNGLKYRSRTEARWAVVFDALGWRHQYEPEGFLLPSGPYCPDFYLPDVDAYFEVKGREPTDREKRKAEELCVATQTVVIVSKGPPDTQRNDWDRDLLTFNPETLDGVEFFADVHAGGFVTGRQPGHPACSIALGNLAHLGALKEVRWRTAFLKAASHRFGVYEN